MQYGALFVPCGNDEDCKRESIRKTPKTICLRFVYASLSILERDVITDDLVDLLNLLNAI